MSDQIIMSKKRIVLAMEGLAEPQNIAWYRGTPHQDILMAIRGVSAHILDTCLVFSIFWFRRVKYSSSYAPYEGLSTPCYLTIHFWVLI